MLDRGRLKRAGKKTKGRNPLLNNNMAKEQSEICSFQMQIMNNKDTLFMG